MSEVLSLDVETVRRRRTRSDRGSIRLTERDLASLRWVGEQYCVRLDQLRRVLGRAAGRVLTESTARAAVKRWSRAELVRSRKVMLGEPGFVWLTARGLREVGLSFKSWEPAASTTSHIYWTNQVRLYVEQRHPEFTWRAERYLRTGKAMQTISDASSHIADAELHGQDVVVGIEVELTSKSAARRESIMKMLAHSYPTVWYFAAPNVLSTLEKTASTCGSSLRERVRIYPLERVR